MCFNVEEMKIGNIKERNIKDNTKEEWEKVVQIFRENKRKREEKREKV